MSLAALCRRLSVTAVLLFGATAALAEPTAIGVVDRVQNSVTAESAGVPRDLAPKGPLLSGDRLVSHENARLEATLQDETKITLGENAVLDIDDFVYAPGKRGGSLALRVLDGTFLFVGGKVEGPSGGNVKITTSFATLGIRGTTVWGGPLDGVFGVLVLAGEVTVTNAGTSVTLKANEGTTIPDAASPPQPAGPWRKARVDRALATISFGN